MADEAIELTVVDRDAWRAWLVEHHNSPAGVWLTLAKKGKRRRRDSGTTTRWRRPCASAGSMV